MQFEILKFIPFVRRLISMCLPSPRGFQKDNMCTVDLNDKLV